MFDLLKKWFLGYIFIISVYGIGIIWLFCYDSDSKLILLSISDSCFVSDYCIWAITEPIVCSCKIVFDKIDFWAFCLILSIIESNSSLYWFYSSLVKNCFVHCLYLVDTLNE